jgi:hypothetical protein
LVGLADLMGQIQSMFDDFTTSTSVQAGLFKAIELHQSLVQFRGRLPEEFDHFERLPHRGRIDLDSEEGEKMVVRFTMCGIYLQLKMLVLLPVLQTSVWSAIRMQPLAISEELRQLTDECVRAALEMVSLVYSTSDIRISNFACFTPRSELSSGTIMPFRICPKQVLSRLTLFDLGARR